MSYDNHKMQLQILNHGGILDLSRLLMTREGELQARYRNEISRKIFDLSRLFFSRYDTSLALRCDPQKKKIW